MAGRAMKNGALLRIPLTIPVKGSVRYSGHISRRSEHMSSRAPLPEVPLEIPAAPQGRSHWRKDSFHKHRLFLDAALGRGPFA